MRHCFNIISILIKVYSKFHIESFRERIGIMFYGCILWFLIGEMSLELNCIKKNGMKDKSKFKFIYHLNHAHGFPFKDFTFNIPCLILDTGISGGAVDEKMNEGCFAMQFLPVVRALVKSRTPWVNLYELINLHPLLKQSCKSFNWKTMEYFDDVRFDMRELNIDTSFYTLSDRLGKELLKLIPFLDDRLKKNGFDDVSVFDYLRFYSDGSLAVQCDMLLEATTAAQPITLTRTRESFAIGAKVCEYAAWKVAVKETIVRAGNEAAHCIIQPK